MSAVEKEAKKPENVDKENGENEEDSQSGNFLDPKKVIINLVYVTYLLACQQVDTSIN